MQGTDGRSSSAGRLERGISLVLLCALTASFVYAIAFWKPARASTAAVVNITVNAGATLTTFTPLQVTAAPGDTIHFALTGGSGAVISSDAPPAAFVEPCVLSTLAPSCDIHITPGVTGDILYSDQSAAVASQTGTITVVGDSATPTPTATTSPSASPTASPSPSPTETASPSPSPSPTGPPEPEPTVHERFLSLGMSKKAVAKGVMESDDPGCVIEAPVKVQKKSKGKWKTLAKILTDSQGHYRAKVPKRNGTYRSLSPKFSNSDGTQVCAKVTSNKVKYRKG